MPVVLSWHAKDVERIGDIALLRMRAGKANATGPAFLDALGTSLDGLLAAPPGALVLTGEGRVFSAGLDLPALVDLPTAALVDFIGRFTDTMLRLFTLPFPVVAAVNGHAVAGGCVLALQADQRLMAEGEGRIGLNEVRLGIGLPAAMVETLRCQVPAATLFPGGRRGWPFCAQGGPGPGAGARGCPWRSACWKPRWSAPRPSPPCPHSPSPR